MNLQDPTWLVTGGAGFVGSHLVDALIARGNRVRVLDDLSTGKARNLSPAAELVRGSVADPAAVRAAMRDVAGVFHLAAVASVTRCTEHWAEAHAINQSGTVHVLEAARDRGALPVVYASSAAVYGTRPEAIARETDAPAPCSPYGCDKLGSELHAGVARTLFGVPAVGLRFFNVYGPRQDGASPYAGVISTFANRLRRGERLVLHGGGAQTRDFVYVADVVRALLAAMAQASDLPPVINVCTGRAVSVRTVATCLASLSGRALQFETGPDRAGDIRHSCGDPALLRAALGIECRVAVGDGLEALLRTGFALGEKAKVA